MSMLKDLHTSCVYRYIDENNVVVYVGKTCDLKSRRNNHRDPKDRLFAELAGCHLEFVGGRLSASDADILETYFIHKYKPRLNKDKTTWGEPTVINLEAVPEEWTPYENIMSPQELRETLRKNGKLTCTHCGRALPRLPSTRIIEFQKDPDLPKYIKTDIHSLCVYCARQAAFDYFCRSKKNFKKVVPE